LILKALTIVYREERARSQRTIYSTISRCLAATRIILFPRTVARFNSMNLIGKLKHKTRDHDPLYFVVYRYYISRQLTLSQRVQVAMDHHQYESQFFNCEYMKQTYNSDGILLWERSFDDLHFTIVLIATPDNRNEGELSIILSVNKVELSKMSFCYLKADVFGLPPYMAILISRNQTSRTPSRDLFDRCFGQNTPQLFCLSAVCGIAMTNEFTTMFGIKHEAQITYKESLDTGFRNSYTALWEKFDGVEIDRQVFMLSVPLNLRPLGLVSRDHRRRARARRQCWDEIVQSTRLSMGEYRALSSLNTPSSAEHRAGQAGLAGKAPQVQARNRASKPSLSDRPLASSPEYLPPNR
jgi:uncharacterized protein VirK/YbjX